MNRQKSAREYDTDKSKAETNLSLFRYIVQVNSNMNVCRQYWECSGANTTSEPSEEVCGLCSFSSSLLPSSSLLFFFFLQPHLSEVCLVAGSVGAHLAVVLAEAETERSPASVSTGSEAAGKVPLGVVSAIVEHRLLAEVGLWTLDTRTSVTAMVN